MECPFLQVDSLAIGNWQNRQQHLSPVARPGRRRSWWAFLLWQPRTLDSATNTATSHTEHTPILKDHLTLLRAVCCAKSSSILILLLRGAGAFLLWHCNLDSETNTNFDLPRRKDRYTAMENTISNTNTNIYKKIHVLWHRTLSTITRFSAKAYPGPTCT